MSQWNTTVHIPWLVASYDTQEGKRWLIYNLQGSGGQRRKQNHGEIVNFCSNPAFINQYWRLYNSIQVAISATNVSFQ